MILEKVYDELMAQIEDLKKAVAGGSSGTKDYDRLDNRPKVNNITLSGNKKSSDLKIAYSMTEAEYAAATKNAESIYCLQENATTFEEEDETASSYIEWSAGDLSGYVATWVYIPSNQNFTGCTAVECDDPAITIDEFRAMVDDGNIRVYLSCEDTTQIGETVTFTFTLTQPAGATRMVKNGLEFGASKKIKELYSGTATASSYALSESIANFDMIILVAGYHQQSPSKDLVITMELPSYLIQEASGVVYSLTSDVYYTNFTFTDNTHITKDAENILFIQRVIGIKC